MADISKITLPTGTTYNLKDATARSSIDELKSALANGGIRYLGVSSTEITDGCETSDIEIKNKEKPTVKEGDIVIYGDDEFIFNGTAWNKFGPSGTFKALAFKDEATGEFTPSGSVSVPIFTGTSTTISVSGTPEGTISISKGAGSANYTPEGTVTQPTFTGTSATISVSGTSAGTISISKGEGTENTNYTPEGTITRPTFTGTAQSITVSGTPTGTITITKGDGDTTNYTPEGIISQPTGTVELQTTKITGISDVGSLPKCTLPTYSVSDETLSITAGTYENGTLPTKDQETTVATGVKSVEITTPTFTGTGAELKATFAGEESTLTGKYTPKGTVSQPTFNGTGAELKATFTGSKVTATGKFKPEGTVSQPTFNGTGAELKATFTGSRTTLETNYTPEGTVSQPTFTGTQGTVKVK